MEELHDIIARRTAPGVLIFDQGDRLLYSNREAFEMLESWQGVLGEQAVPAEVFQLCREMREGRGGAARCLVRLPEDAAAHAIVHYSLRALFLGSHGTSGEASHVMVLMEKIVRQRTVDVEKARLRYQLSKREAEVVRLICRGLGNKEISDTIFVSEFTVKDHLKNIMRKMGATSRNEIFALLL